MGTGVVRICRICCEYRRCLSCDRLLSFIITSLGSLGWWKCTELQPFSLALELGPCWGLSHAGLTLWPCAPISAASTAWFLNSGISLPGLSAQSPPSRHTRRVGQWSASRSYFQLSWYSLARAFCVPMGHLPQRMRIEEFFLSALQTTLQRVDCGSFPLLFQW